MSSHVDAWWNATPAPAEEPRTDRRQGAPYLDARTAAARVELIARRALDNRPAALAALAWYSDARRFSDGLARAYGLGVEAVAGAIAALSPQVAWSAQVAWAPAIFDAWKQGADLPGPGLGVNKRKAGRILAGEAPLDVLGGPKVRAFYRGIIAGGRTEAVCVDRHAWAAAGGPADATLTGPRYGEAVRAYLDASAALRLAFRELAPILSPANVQALVWVWWRDNSEARY
jgi:hypothetical protein